MIKQQNSNKYKITDRKNQKYHEYYILIICLCINPKLKLYIYKLLASSIHKQIMIEKIKINKIFYDSIHLHKIQSRNNDDHTSLHISRILNNAQFCNFTIYCIFSKIIFMVNLIIFNLFQNIFRFENRYQGIIIIYFMERNLDFFLIL